MPLQHLRLHLLLFDRLLLLLTVEVGGWQGPHLLLLVGGTM